ncbi:MAG: LPS export ABC transporter permease LptG [Sphingomicrobium sp.]
MINVDFMPSGPIARYTVRLFVTRTLAVLASLVLILMTLDLLGESGRILAAPGNGQAQLGHYVVLRLPLLISRFLPFSALLGTLIAFAGLNQHSEVIAMKAAGISAHQILAPLILASALLAGVAFAFNETVVVHSARAVDVWSDNDYRAVPVEPDVISNVWILDGDDLVRARHVGGSGAGLHLENVTIYERDRGTLRQVIDIKRAVQLPGGGARGWLLSDLTTYDAAMGVVSHTGRAVGLHGVSPLRFTLAKVDPTEQDYWQLRRSIAELEAAGRQTDEARAGMWHKIAAPVSTMLMPLLAAIAAFGLARSGQVLLRATVGMALGFTYFVVDNFSLSMGNVGIYPPFLAAWAPVLLFFLIGETVLIRSEE